MRTLGPALASVLFLSIGACGGDDGGETATCETEGVARTRDGSCVLPLPDAGKPCNDVSECLGSCEGDRRHVEEGYSGSCTPSTHACNPVHDGRHTLVACPY